MKEEIIKLLREFISKKYEDAGTRTGCGGNWSGNREIVRGTSLEDFLRFLESREEEIRNLHTEIKEIPQFEGTLQALDKLKFIDVVSGDI